MAIKILNKKGDWLVQVQRAGLRKTKRGTGGEAEAKRAEAVLIAEVEHDLKMDEAARLLGVDLAAEAKAKAVPTLQAFFETRWLEHARVVQNDTTRQKQVPAFNHLLYRLGDKTLDEIMRPSVINAFVEAMKDGAPTSFATRRDGTPRRSSVPELRNATINKSLMCLKALLNLAHAEGVVATQPRIDMLPQDDSTAVLPPTEEQYRTLVAVCGDYAARAPLLPELVEFMAETGLRRGEAFHLTWGSVDLERAAVRIEMQMKARMVNGRPWKPKHGKFREVPLSARAKEILEQLRAAGAGRLDQLVFPNRGGAPFERMEGAPKGAGIGWFSVAAEAAGLKGIVTFHSLRHLFAVRLLTRGVPITVVSEILGHSHIQVTVKRYGRFASDAKVKWDAVRVLDAPAPSSPPPAPGAPGAT